MAKYGDEYILELRRQLAAAIVRSLGPVAQHVEAPHFGIPQPKMSELNRGIVHRCSTEWLIRRIHRMGGSVSVTVTLGDARLLWIEELSQRRKEGRR